MEKFNKLKERYITAYEKSNNTNVKSLIYVNDLVIIVFNNGNPLLKYSLVEFEKIVESLENNL